MSSIKVLFRDNRAFFFLVLYLLFILPMSTYVASSSYFQLSFHQAIVFFLFASSVAGVVMICVAGFFSENQRRYIFSALLLACLLAFYNYNFHQYGGKIVGVDANVFVAPVSFPDVLLYTILAVVIFVVRRHIFSDRDAIAVFFLLANAAIFSSQLSFSDISQTEEADKDEKLSRIYELSSGLNVLHIIFDGFQGTVFNEILSAEPDLKEKFPGFIFYPDALTSSEVTYLSLPASFSAKVFDGTEPISEYLSSVGFGEKMDKENFVTPPLLSRLADEGFRVDVLAANGGRMPRSPDYNFYVKTDSFNHYSNYAFNLALILDVTLAKIMPWRLKMQVYRKGNWLLSKYLESDVSRANRAIEFIQTFSSRISVQGVSPVYKIFHLLAPHGPWTTDENCRETAAEVDSTAVYNQTRCTVFAIVAMVDQLRAKGLYEKTAILIHGDHGIGQELGLSSKVDLVQLPRFLGNVNPLVLLKPFSTTESALQSNNKQIQLIDIPATVFDILSLQHSFAGRSMLQRAGSDNVVREFFEFEPNRITAAKLDRVTSTKRFTVTGPITSRDAWELVRE
ncbi:MAG: hypothetical protein ACI9DC_000752 [Gammaproteobacteria bacterium]|jgi:hypothetical protein